MFEVAFSFQTLVPHSGSIIYTLTALFYIYGGIIKGHS